MAPRTKARLPAQWIQDENRQISQFVAQEAEDFMFSARNEVEWLNEHMADIFSKSEVYDALHAQSCLSSAKGMLGTSRKFSKLRESFEERHQGLFGDRIRSRLVRLVDERKECCFLCCTSANTVSSLYLMSSQRIQARKSSFRNKNLLLER